MYLVVRKETAASLEGVMVAAARATYVVAARYADDPRYADTFGPWGSRSFRKVCLRANEKRWPQVADAAPRAARPRRCTCGRSCDPRWGLPELVDTRRNLLFDRTSRSCRGQGLLVGRRPITLFRPVARLVYTTGTVAGS